MTTGANSTLQTRTALTTVSGMSYTDTFTRAKAVSCARWINSNVRGVSEVAVVEYIATGTAVVKFRNRVGMSRTIRSTAEFVEYRDIEVVQ